MEVIKEQVIISKEQVIISKKQVILIQKVVRGHIVRRNQNPSKYIKYYYETYLKDMGCKMPSNISSFYKALEFLYIHIKKDVKIDDIRVFVENQGIKLKGGTDSLQIRHLGCQNGFNLLKGKDVGPNGTIVKRSHYMLLNLSKVFNGFCKEKRKEKIDTNNWDELKKEYQYRCVNCGSIENKPMRWNGNQITILQQGHMDPRRPLTNDNVIPQCSFCNQQYKNKAVFNKRGFVIEYNNDGFKFSNV